MKDKNAIFYIMSGTGNTFRLGCWIKELFEKDGGDAETVMIENSEPDRELARDTVDWIGVLFPTHGFLPPWSMIKFLFKLPRGKGKKAFAGATRGAFRMGRLLVPGAAGLAHLFAALVLFIKGYAVKGMFSLDMPANMLSLHWGMKEKNAHLIMTKSRKRTEKLVNRLLQGKRLLFTRNNFIEFFWGALLLYFFPLFPPLYLMMGRIYMGKMMFSGDKCVGCGLCARSCPNEAIRMKGNGKQKRPYWTYHCEVCMRCMGYCPQKAVQAGHSWGVILYYITAVPAGVYLLSWLRGMYPFIPAVSGYWFGTLANLVYIYPAMFIAYWLFWQMLRVPFINAIFSYTTFTRLYRRYHEPGTRVTHMTGNK